MAAGEGERWGSYVLDEKIAAGGMGEVFRARRVGAASFSKQVCVKRLHAHLSSDPEFVAMFLDEARTGSKLRHRNIVGIDDLGEHGGQYFLAMEYVNGVDLARVEERARKSGTAIPADVGAFVAAEVLAALHAAHTAVDPDDGQPLRIVHRDVSPQNILVSFGAEVKLTDFGIARAERRARATVGAVVRGRFGYMPLEQAGGAELDGRTDLFALGVVLYELLAGRRPFRGDKPDATLEEIVAAQVMNDRPPLASLRPDLPPALVALVEKLLAPRADDRFASAAAALGALTEVRETLTGSMSLAALMARLFPGLASALYAGPTGVAPAATTPQRAAATDASAPRASLVEGTPPPGGAVDTGARASRSGTPPGGSPPSSPAPVDPYATTSARAKLELVAQTDPHAPVVEGISQTMPRGAPVLRERGTRWWIAGAAAAVLVVGTALAVPYLRRERAPSTTTASSAAGATAPAATRAPAQPAAQPAPEPPAPAPVPTALVADAGAVAQQTEDPPPTPANDRRRGRGRLNAGSVAAQGPASPVAPPPAPNPTPPAPPPPAPAPVASDPPEPRYGTLRVLVLPFGEAIVNNESHASPAVFRLREGTYTVRTRGAVDATHTVTIRADAPTVLRVDQDERAAQ